MNVMLLLHAEADWLSSDKLIGLITRHVDFFKSLGDKVLAGGILGPAEKGWALERLATSDKRIPAPPYGGSLVLGGYYVLEVPSLEAAEDIALAIPMVERLIVEIRPMMGHVQGGGAFILGS